MTCYSARLPTAFALILGLAWLAPSAPAHAQAAIPKDVQNNCVNDYKRFCGDYGLGSNALKLCMRKAGPSLSPACVQALVRAGQVSQAEVDKVKSQAKGRKEFRPVSRVSRSMRSANMAQFSKLDGAGQNAELRHSGQELRSTPIMKRILCLSLVAAATLASSAAFAADKCETLTLTGHPQYPVIAWKDGDKIVGAAPALVEAIGKALGLPVVSKYTGSWSDAQAAAKDGTVDMIVGVYYNDERAQFLDYVQPAFIFDPVVAFVAKGKAFNYAGQDDLIGKKGATNKGESYGNEFDAFIKDKLTVERTDGIDDAFKDMLDGKVDYVLAGYYPGLAEATRSGVEDKVQALDPSLLSPEMFVAFSKKSPCASLMPKFSEELTRLTTDGSFNKMVQDATAAWDAAPDTE